MDSFHRLTEQNMSFIEKFLPLDLHKIAIQESFLLEIEEPA